jgi:prevent-host-death family protein
MTFWSYQENGMATVGVYEAKTQLPKLLDQVAQGERVMITRHGKPIAMLVPVTGHARPVTEVIRSLRAFRKGRRRGRASLRALIAHGRR